MGKDRESDPPYRGCSLSDDKKQNAKAHTIGALRGIGDHSSLRNGARHGTCGHTAPSHAYPGVAVRFSLRSDIRHALRRVATASQLSSHGNAASLPHAADHVFRALHLWTLQWASF